MTERQDAATESLFLFVCFLFFSDFVNRCHYLLILHQRVIEHVSSRHRRRRRRRLGLLSRVRDQTRAALT